MKILNRFTDETIYESEAQTLKELVGLAIKSRANLYGAKLYGAKSIHDVMTIGRIGSREAYLTALLTDDGIICKTGCFSGTLKGFKKAVKETYGSNEHAEAYGLAIKLIELRFAPQLKKLKDTQ